MLEQAPSSAQRMSAVCAHEADWLDAGKHVAPASVDLVYADPPFNTGQTQRDRAGDFEDRFSSTGDYLAWLEPRLRAVVPLIKPTGSIILHLDWRTSHRVRVLLDELLGEDRFVNHLIWHYGLGGSSPRRFARKHDDLLWYCLDPERYYFDPPRVPATSQRMAGQTKKATDVLDIPAINNMAKERLGYPTQKPLALLELLIGACCPGVGARVVEASAPRAVGGGCQEAGQAGLVLDPCCGSGTTLAAAQRLGRRAVGLDINPAAIALTRQRLA